ncbi:MAG: hypothetical protein HY713_12980 [candidate division NC10 bacterium]|nr:hypothetical protein [candidate division NC10 bacterium]
MSEVESWNHYCLGDLALNAGPEFLNGRAREQNNVRTEHPKKGRGMLLKTLLKHAARVRVVLVRTPGDVRHGDLSQVKAESVDEEPHEPPAGRSPIREVSQPKLENRIDLNLARSIRNEQFPVVSMANIVSVLPTTGIHEHDEDPAITGEVSWADIWGLREVDDSGGHPARLEASPAFHGTPKQSIHLRRIHRALHRYPPQES